MDDGLDAFKQRTPFDRASQVGHRHHLDIAWEHIRRLSHRRPHRIPKPRQLCDQRASDESRCPGDENARHDLPPENRTSNQLNSSPIGRLPTSPRKICATGLLNGAKPINPPQSATATTTPCAGSAPRYPMNTSPTVIGTNSATVIQSMPSMKLVKLTNQRHASSSSARSIHHGNIGTTRNSAGRLASMKPTATVCSRRRGATSIVQRSSAAPTSDKNTVAANTSQSDAGSLRLMVAALAATASAAMITAIPPPCGVDWRWDDREFGWARR